MSFLATCVDLYNKYVKSILIDILYKYSNVHCTCISSIIRHSMLKEGDVMKKPPFLRECLQYNMNIIIHNHVYGLHDQMSIFSA